MGPGIVSRKIFDAFPKISKEMVAQLLSIWQNPWTSQGVGQSSTRTLFPQAEARDAVAGSASKFFGGARKSSPHWARIQQTLSANRKAQGLAGPVDHRRTSVQSNVIITSPVL